MIGEHLRLAGAGGLKPLAWTVSQPVQPTMLPRIAPISPGNFRVTPSAAVPTPPRLLQKLADRLYPTPEERSAFLRCVAPGVGISDATASPGSSLSSASPALIWCGDRPLDVSPPPDWSVLPPMSWQPAWVDRLAAGARPGAHPLHASGAYYCLDFSSVWAASALLALPGERSPSCVIDVCAAPGGKSVFAWRALQPALLVANEAIGKRVGRLRGNLARCGVAHWQVTNCDPSRLAERWAGRAEVAIVDAPCSGQSLLAKGEANPGCCHPVTVAKNAGRQRRILAHAGTLVRPGGWLVYSTCTYALEENEGVCRWWSDRDRDRLGQGGGDWRAVAVPHLEPWRSPHATFPCYRLAPQAGLGAGAFVALFQRGGG